MKTFACQACGQAVYFPNVTCNHCGATLGFLPDELRLVALSAQPDGTWVPTRPTPKLKPRRGLVRWFSRRPETPDPAQVSASAWRQCANYAEHQVCNWMVPADSPEPLCPVCRLNRTIPNLARPGNLAKWARIERGKRRLVYGLLRLGLPVRSRWEDADRGLAFDFLSSQDAPPGTLIITGHASGLITLNIDEADPVARERMRVDMEETYRTLVGHFRHEIGHYYWDQLVRDDDTRLAAFRDLFGDERQDYGAALDDHYCNGPPPDWQDRFLTAYASSHPWEDWAESFAHYLHITDTLETAAHYGIEVDRRLPDGSVQQANPEFDPYDIADFQPLIDHWLPLTFALNSLNQSMGQQFLYPFVMPPPAIEKLAFVHQVIRAATGR